MLANFSAILTSFFGHLLGFFLDPFVSVSLSLCHGHVVSVSLFLFLSLSFYLSCPFFHQFKHTHENGWFAGDYAFSFPFKRLFLSFVNFSKRNNTLHWVVPYFEIFQVGWSCLGKTIVRLKRLEWPITGRVAHCKYGLNFDNILIDDIRQGHCNLSLSIDN